jgi:hypothetical protein
MGSYKLPLVLLSMWRARDLSALAREIQTNLSLVINMVWEFVYKFRQTKHTHGHLTDSLRRACKCIAIVLFRYFVFWL